MVCTSRGLYVVEQQESLFMILACFRWRGPMPAIVRYFMSFMSLHSRHTTLNTISFGLRGLQLPTSYLVRGGIVVCHVYVKVVVMSIHHWHFTCYQGPNFVYNKDKNARLHYPWRRRCRGQCNTSQLNVTIDLRIYWQKEVLSLQNTK